MKARVSGMFKDVDQIIQECSCKVGQTQTVRVTNLNPQMQTLQSSVKKQVTCCEPSWLLGVYMSFARLFWSRPFGNSAIQNSKALLCTFQQTCLAWQSRDHNDGKQEEKLSA